MQDPAPETAQETGLVGLTPTPPAPPMPKLSHQFLLHTKAQGIKVLKAHELCEQLTEKLGVLSIDAPIPEGTPDGMRMSVCKADSARDSFHTELERLKTLFRKECAALFMLPPYEMPIAREKARTVAIATFEKTINAYLGDLATEAGIPTPAEGDYFHMHKKQGKSL